VFVFVANCGKRKRGSKPEGDYSDICASQPADDYRRCLHPGNCHKGRVYRTEPVYLVSKLKIIGIDIDVWISKGYYLARMTEITLQLALVVKLGVSGEITVPLIEVPVARLST
jgi:hypothetical protein